MIFFDTLKETAERLPKSKFVLVDPTARPGVEWYAEKLDAIRKEYALGIAKLAKLNISLLKNDDLPSQLFVEDYVHFTPGAGSQFVNAILYYAEKSFEAEVVDMDQDEVEDIAKPSGSGTTTAKGSVTAPASGGAKAKSAERAALRPSLPNIPIPT